MVREIDAREIVERADPGRRAALEAAAATVSDDVLPGDHRVQVASVDPVTGNTAVLVSRDAATQQGDHVSRALRHLQRVSPALGFAAEEAPEYVADPQDQTTSAGAVVVHLRQQYKGIPIYDAAETVRFDPDGSLREVAGRSVSVPSDLPVSPALTAEDALRTAAAHVAEPGDPEDAPRDQFGEPLVDPGMDLAAFAPVARTTGADRPDRPTTFDAPPFPHAVTVALIWVPTGGSLRLGWHTKLAVPNGAVHRVVVDALDGRILLATRLTRGVAGRADVVLRAGGQVQTVDLPLDAASYGAPLPADLPPGFPEDWLLDGTTRGACVHAVVEPGGVPATGTSDSGTVVFAPAAGSHDALVVNLFALCSGMHDLLYVLGFREADGNFQSDNHGRGGRARDPVLARVHPGPVWGTANMGTPPDGSRPTMNMGLVSSTNRHTALDADVVFHEYVHGLTNRLVGGPLNDMALEAVQSAGMGEGWSDFFACVALGKTVVGDWVVDRRAGIRAFAYDDAFPHTYADLGTGRYQGDSVHALGEVWCATLMTLARRIGAWTAAQLVVDGLKLTAANPSFLAARDAVLLAADQLARARGDDDRARAEVVHRVWEVFAGYGMGPGARTLGAESLTGIVADFEAPPRQTAVASVTATAEPRLPVPDADAAGVVSMLDLPDSGPIEDLTVTVDIRHPYVGDLVVALVPPSGAPVVLHSRTGGRARDLRASWDSSTHAGLGALVGSPCGGTWTLRVADRAPRDVGTLDAWTITAAVGEQRRTVEVEAVPGLAVPDDQPDGISSALSVTDGGTVSALTLDVDITHTYVGDLEVALVGPDGTRAVVHGRKGGSADNLITTYLSAEGEPLAAFVGRPLAGTWTLVVADRAGKDVGKLNRWRLRATT